MEAKKRKLLALLTLGIVLIITAFLWIVNQAQPQEMQGALTLTLFILSAFSVVVLMLYIFYGELFNNDGSLQKSQILLMVTAVILIMQVTLAFATYSFKQLDFENKSLEKAKELYASVETDLLQANTLLKDAGEEISAISVINDGNFVISSTDKEKIGKKMFVDPLKSYRFPNGKVTMVMDISKDYQNKIIWKILLDLLTILVSSIILTIELGLFMTKFVEDRFACSSVGDLGKDYKMVRYVRQISFFFYFASNLAIAFVTIVALDLGGSFLGFTGNVLAGIPQSAEFLFICVAIFATATIIEKRGWKVSFIAGLCIVALGTLLSAVATNIVLFIISRAVVGLGYGFCWMTMRNFALFTSSDQEQNTCFARLNAGIYAGIICGAGFGSVLADIIGYIPVLFVSAILTAACSVAVLKLKNATYHKDLLEKSDSQEIQSKNKNLHDILQAVFFIVLMIVPACIIGSFLGYYLPIYFTDIGKATSDIGRAQLVYGLIIVYGGPFIVKLLNRYSSLFAWNIAYNIIFAAALILFGLKGGFVMAMLVVLVFGFADSFGFVVQNNYFLNLDLVKKLGESRSLSYISLIKKQAEMLGPIAFGFAFMGGSYQGVAIMGIIFLIAVALYAVIGRISKVNIIREG